MKVRITFKDPDGPYDCIREAVENSRPEGLDDLEWELVRDERVGNVRESLSEWLPYGEYVTIVFDTDGADPVVEKDSE